jgi:thiol:disulfide interchange protein
MMETLFSFLRHTLESNSLLSMFLALGIAYLGGILSSFTPCIYPMIPITIGLIGGTSQKNIKTGWLLSSAYVLGMSVIYTILGVLASVSGKIFGTYTNSSGWYLFLGVILAFSSLWMFEVFHFDPNAFLSRFMKKKHAPGTLSGIAERNEANLFGAFTLGVSSGFIASPCTTPVLTTILSFIASQNSIIFGALLMFFFALGLGTILVLIGTFTGAVKVLPKSGAWLKTLKIVSGLLILGISLYYVYKAGTLK